MTNFKTEIKTKLDEIASELIKDDYDPGGIGLLEGKAGIVLFLFLYGHYTEDQTYGEKASELLHKCVETIDDPKNNVSVNYSQGLSGLAWTLDFLARNDYIERVKLFEPFDEIICQSMLNNFANKNWDALHGGIGICIYLFTRIENDDVKTAISKAVNILEEQGVEDDKTVKWETYNNLTKEFGYNFGLAHGIPSIVVFLVNCFEKGIEKETCMRLLKKSVNYLVSNMVEGADNVFPRLITKDNSVKAISRLGWCYGDPGVLVALIQANRVLKTLDETIKFTLKKMSPRKSDSNNGIVDSCICHGSVGIMHIYHYISLSGYKDYFDSKILDYWISSVLDMATFKGGPAGYKTYIQDEEHETPKYRSAFGLLEGISGNGLCLLSLLTRRLKWSECIYIS